VRTGAVSPATMHSPSREDDGEGAAERLRRAERESGCDAGAGNGDAHNTCRLAEELSLLGGPALCLPFLQLGSAPRAAAMRILLALLLSDEA
jgi:hypothetical protein